MLFPEKYIPNDYLREIVLAKGNSGMLFLYHAMLAGLKPLLDEWIPPSRIKEFEKACEKYGLYTAKEAHFLDLPFSDRIIGKEFATTTKCFGAPVGSEYKGRIHIYISKSEEVLDEGKRYGWYPLAINGRCVSKPPSDHYWFGEFLGYPACCRHFFMEHSNHQKYANTLKVPFENTKAPPHFLCNSLTKDSYSYIYHIPCGFDCKNTIKHTSKLQKFIYRKDPEYGRLIDAHLNLPFLVCRERDIYAFDGTLDGNTLTYKNCFFVDDYLYQPKYLDLLKKGNRVVIEEKEAKVYSNQRKIGSIQKTSSEDWFFISFEDR